ncbi:hypothetical protein [Pectobacterium brasiliense]|uniref:hypothetical protein n=1 Tax=Pectobacterium brasiliense TaxID=180957 RepID=UPI002A7FB4CB|nr:hypothetical protein [Pectobacterium brasiliense]MDY4347003.1 hypothetical protein [Pectobacterium brasiliense]
MVSTEMLRIALNPTGYLIEKALGATLNVFSEKAADSNVSTEQLSEEAGKAKIKSTVLLEQAKVEQETSIAKRILIAEEVEIEEFYDASGSGGAGAKTDGTNFTLGVHGEGKKVTKRIIRFKGFNSEAISLLAAPSETEISTAE